jgi:glycogen debranching enzyme
VEHGPFAVGGYRYGCHAEAERVCAAMFQAAALFEYRRLPECFAGHPRDDAHPFPAIYPAANVPQAWSASTVVTMLQAMLGLYPQAPEGVLYLDPRLPEWLPEITLRNLRIGDASLDLRFRRDPEGGATTHEVLDQRGELEVRRKSIPFGENP